MTISAILLAGGESQRYQKHTGASTSKLLEVLATNKTVLAASFHALLNIQNPVLSYIIIVCHPDRLTEYKTEIANCLLETPTMASIEFIHGGETRRQSVFNALAHLKEDSPDMVLIHDAARPLVQTNSIQKLIAEFINNQYIGASLAHKITDTIKTIKTNNTLESIPRESLWGIETPQLFNFKTLYEAHQNIPSETAVTDDLMLLELSGAKPLGLTENSASNLKITTPQDLAIARVLYTSTP